MDEGRLKIDKQMPLLVRTVLDRNRDNSVRQWQNSLRGNLSLPSRRLTAGVLLLLCQRPDNRRDSDTSRRWVLQLIKRSARTAQGGDISCPGGMLSPVLDWAFGLLFIRSGLLPLPPFHSAPEPITSYARQKRTMTLFFANALRESWEELRLNPLRVSLLGILPTYSLHLFHRTIFPLVAMADPDWVPSPNSEVEKIIEIPLDDFFRAESYGRYLIQASDPMPTSEHGPWEFPCLIHAGDGGEEILWGATFYIIMNFIRIVFAYQLPDMNGKRIRYKTLNTEYLTGNPEKPGK